MKIPCREPSACTTGRALINEGTIAAGTSPGTLNITGDLVLAPSSVTVIEIQAPGAVAGADYDVISVSGNVRGMNGLPADSWGTIDVRLLGGFAPVEGTVFGVIRGATVSGAFGTVNAPASQPMTPAYLASGVNVIAGTVPVQATTEPSPPVEAAINQAVQQTNELANVTQTVQETQNVASEAAAPATEETSTSSGQKQAAAEEKQAASGDKPAQAERKKEKPAVCR